jgi:hypothetical protein
MALRLSLGSLLFPGTGRGLPAPISTNINGGSGKLTAWRHGGSVVAATPQCTRVTIRGNGFAIAAQMGSLNFSGMRRQPARVGRGIYQGPQLSRRAIGALAAQEWLFQPLDDVKVVPSMLRVGEKQHRAERAMFPRKVCHLFAANSAQNSHGRQR